MKSSRPAPPSTATAAGSGAPRPTSTVTAKRTAPTAMKKTNAASSLLSAESILDDDLFGGSNIGSSSSNNSSSSSAGLLGGNYQPPPDSLPYDAVEQYLCQVENQLDLAREMDNCVLYGDSSAMLRVVHDKVKDLLALADYTLAEWQRRGTPLPEGIAGKKEVEKKPVPVQKWARWTKEDDLALEEAIQVYGERDLKAIAAKIETKSASQCRERIRRMRVQSKMGGKAADRNGSEAGSGAAASGGGAAS